MASFFCVNGQQTTDFGYAIFSRRDTEYRRDFFLFLCDFATLLLCERFVIFLSWTKATTMSFFLKILNKTAFLSLLKTINQQLKNIFKKVYFYVDR